MRKTEDNITNITKLSFQQVTVRAFQLSDCDDVYEFGTDEKVLRFLPWGGLTKKSQVKVFLEKNYIGDPSTYAIVHKIDQKCVGLVEVKVNIEKNSACIGYLLNSRYWNHGIMSEVISKIVTYCFDEMKLDYLEASHYSGNIGSGRVLIKSGFEIDVHENQQLDVVYYRLTKQQYEKKGLGTD